MPCGCLLLAVAGSLVPRVTIVFLWVFTDRVSDAFNGFILPLAWVLGLTVAPLVYVVVWWGGDGTSAWGWVVVLIAVCVDIGNYTAGG